MGIGDASVNRIMRKTFKKGGMAAVIMLSNPAWAQVVDPQLLMDELVRQQKQLEAQRHRNEMMRLELERTDLEARLRYRRASDRGLMEELMRYCPSGEPPCRPLPPEA